MRLVSWTGDPRSWGSFASDASTGHCSWMLGNPGFQLFLSNLEQVQAVQPQNGSTVLIYWMGWNWDTKYESAVELKPQQSYSMPEVTAFHMKSSLEKYSHWSELSKWTLRQREQCSEPI